jgi:SAM-dependent methyltransferase
MLKKLIKYMFQSQSIQRFNMNEYLKNNIKLHGRVLDLASGRSMYSKFLKGDFIHIRADLKLKYDVDIEIDFNKRFPCKDNEYDYILLLNAIYISPDPKSVLDECRRVLKRDGTMYVTFPCIFNENPEPKDYHRFTKEYIRLITAEFNEVEIIPIGNRVESALYILDPILRLRVLKGLFLLILLPLCNLLKFVSRGYIEYPIFYMAILKK